jgi:hypothetical protein
VSQYAKRRPELRSDRSRRGADRFPAPWPGGIVRPGSGNRVLLALVLVAASGMGCIFDTRTPDPPGDPPIPWINPTEPRLVLENIKVTLNRKSASNYTRSLSDDFAFEPDVTDAGTVGESFFAGWNKDREGAAFSQIVNSAGTINFIWTPKGDPLSVPDKPEDKYYENIVYSMQFAKTQPEPGNITFSGKADLYLRETGGVWAVYKWVDKRDGSTNSTLGMARYTGVHY